MPERLLTSIAHVELTTPDLEASVVYARDILGLDVVEEQGESVYLRCWGDYYRYSLVLTAASEPGLGHASWRAEGPEQMEEAIRRIEASGTKGEWLDDLRRPRPRLPVHRSRRSPARDLLGRRARGRASR